MLDFGRSFRAGLARPRCDVRLGRGNRFHVRPVRLLHDSSVAYGADGRLALLYREETNDERDMHLVLWDQADNKSRGSA